MSLAVATWGQLQDKIAQPDLNEKIQAIRRRLASLRILLVAFSGGVDSSVVGALVRLSISEDIGPPDPVRGSIVEAVQRQGLLLTAESPSLSARQRGIALQVAAEIGLPHQFLASGEAADPEYQKNDTDRCFYCKSHLYSLLQSICARFPAASILSGTNADDLSDFRPGLRAAANFQVVAPLAEAGMGKSEVRQIALILGLSVHDLPASPCLASRLAYGVAVTPDRLRQVEAAEDLLWQAGFSDVRVRMLAPNVAKLEVPLVEVQRLQAMGGGRPIGPADAVGPGNGLAEQTCAESLENSPASPERAGQRLPSELWRQLSELGFDDIQIDPRGLRSGNLNDLVSLG